MLVSRFSKVLQLKGLSEGIMNPPLSNLRTSSPVVHQDFRPGRRFSPSHCQQFDQRQTRRLPGAAKPLPTQLAGWGKAFDWNKDCFCFHSHHHQISYIISHIKTYCSPVKQQSQAHAQVSAGRYEPQPPTRSRRQSWPRS